MNVILPEGINFAVGAVPTPAHTASTSAKPSPCTPLPMPSSNRSIDYAHDCATRWLRERIHCSRDVTEPKWTRLLVKHSLTSRWMCRWTVQRWLSDNGMFLIYLPYFSLCLLWDVCLESMKYDELFYWLNRVITIVWRTLLIKNRSGDSNNSTSSLCKYTISPVFHVERGNLNPTDIDKKIVYCPNCSISISRFLWCRNI